MNHKSFTFSSLRSSKTYWHRRNASFPSAQNLSFETPSNWWTKAAFVFLTGFWINRPGCKVPNCKFSLKNLSETLLNRKVLPQFTGLQFWCSFYFLVLFWKKECKLHEFRLATTKFSKEIWITTFQSLDLLLEKCCLSWILPFSEIARNKFQLFSLCCIPNKLITFSVPQGPNLISDYQAKPISLWFYHERSPAK